MALALLATVGGFGAFVHLRSAEPELPELLPTEAGPDASTPVAPEQDVLERMDSGLPRAGQWRHGFVVVDFDGDGHLDLVHGPARKSPVRTPQVFLGDGRGRFQLSTRYTFPALEYDRSEPHLSQDERCKNAAWAGADDDRSLGCSAGGARNEMVARVWGQCDMVPLFRALQYALFVGNLNVDGVEE